MRISTANSVSRAIYNMEQRQERLSATQDQMTSGKRVSKASDDPADAARSERALAQKARNDATLRAVGAARSATSMIENAMGDAQDLMQTAHETIVQLGNSSYGNADRDVLVKKLEGIREQMLGIANRQDANGHYLFGAKGTTTAPFTDNGSGTIVYSAGTSGTMMAAAINNDPLTLTADGDKAWKMSSPTGTDVFQVLKDAITQFSTPNPTGTQLSTWTGNALSGLSAASDVMQAARTEAGEHLNRIDAAEERLTALNVSIEQDRSNATDLDFIEALSNFQNQQTGYDAALKAYASVQRMSLFQYINP